MLRDYNYDSFNNIAKGKEREKKERKRKKGKKEGGDEGKKGTTQYYRRKELEK